jgi:uncharacterized membrane protein YfhO
MTSALTLAGLLPCFLAVHTWSAVAGLTLLLLLAVVYLVFAWRELRRAMAADAHEKRRQR